MMAVFKVAGTMFDLVTLDSGPGSVSLKCDPDLAVVLRRRYAAITAPASTSTSVTGTRSHWTVRCPRMNFLT